MSPPTASRRPCVVITGAGRGIGRGLAGHYLEAGWLVVATARGEQELAELTRAGARAEHLDVTDQRSTDELSGALAGLPVDVLVNNAGTLGPARQSTSDMDFDGFADTLATNVLGPLRVTQALLPNLRAAAPARVVNISSRMGSLSYAKSDTVAYRASKAALNKVTQCLATDLAASDIAIVAVHPGWVRTRIGGEEADIDVATSVAGLVKVIDAVSTASTGRFLDHSGAALAW